MSSLYPSTRRIARAFGTLMLLFAGHAAAYVSVGSGCQYNDLQAAIDAQSTTGTYELHVRAGYVSGPISYNNKSIWIFGGYPSCDAPSPIPYTGLNFSDLSEIDGSRNSGRPAISVSGNSRLALHNFNVHGADNGSGNGGGIAYNGSGDHSFLAIASSIINNNKAGRGAGVFYRSTSNNALMSLEDYSWIESNTASISGGGIRLEGTVHLTALGNPASIDNNVANPNSSDGSGGGLQMRDNTTANIGSPGNSGFAYINVNKARVGGGVSVENNAVLNLYTAVPGQLARIENNQAAAGAGVYLSGEGGAPTFCMVGGGINFNATTVGGNGSAIQVNGGNAHVYADDIASACPGTLDGFANCTAGQPCNTITNNVSDRQNTATININEGSSAGVYLRHVLLASNFGGNLMYSSTSTDPQLSDCVITGNDFANSLVTTAHATLGVVQCSIAGNHLASGVKVFRESGTVFSLYDSIIWEPQNPTLGGSGHSVRDVIASDAGEWNPADFVQFFNAFNADPLFVNAGAGDLHLQDGSPAVDASPTGTQYDLDNHPRGIDVVQAAGSPNLGLFDLGAYEVQHIDVSIPVTFPPVETFDELGPAGTLPANWQNVSSHPESVWVLANDQVDSGMYSAFAPDARNANDATLTTTPFHVVHGGQVSFRQRVGLEAADNVTAYDGARLEIQIGNDTEFREVTEAGGQIVQGGYDHVIAQGVGNALPGAGVWSGDVPYSSVLVALPHAANGQDVKLRWRVVTDQNNGWAGYWLDSIQVAPDDGQTDPDDNIFQNGFDP
ncbi:hypothetical protein FHW12_002919 [Dokdonella fugitiva]|uniref:Parallel beta helix pectate lyase-like protein n=1 Tax=Dokdonella fugitiva TaxID=328517 RepID=A0A839F277_9GAMM|nr:hypothetical protein [Dokdonella fugitiva]MBA8888686.1 hypothetical protein [Dokdonella fugitiva]